jgi:hypothetical protein
MTRRALPDERGWYCLKGDIDPATVAGLQAVGPIPKLSITAIELVTVRHVSRLSPLYSVEQVWLWCDVTRRAMRRVIQLPGLRSLDVLCIRRPGSLANFDKATSLRSFRANHYMSEEDLLSVSECPTLEEIGAQNSELTRRALSALLELQHLRALDLEGTAFDDAMARRIARSRTISSLDLGATRITGAGLKWLVEMPQLRLLDLWATKVTEADLALLRHCPDLQYISLGNFDGLPSLDAERVVPLLLDMPSLKRVWLDGIPLRTEHRLALESKLESVRITQLADAV